MAALGRKGGKTCLATYGRSFFSAIRRAQKHIVRKPKHEVWRAIRQGAYEVSNWGRVRRAETKRIKQLYVGPNGYAIVGLFKHETALVHQLVAFAFLGPCPIGKQVNHKNGVKTDNWPTNLEYVTPSENMQHAVELGLHNPSRSDGVHNGNAKLTAAQVKRIRRGYANGRTQAALAKEFGVSQPQIGNIVRRKNWK